MPSLLSTTNINESILMMPYSIMTQMGTKIRIAYSLYQEKQHATPTMDISVTSKTYYGKIIISSTNIKKNSFM